jgi:hypothetical protein
MLTTVHAAGPPAAALEETTFPASSTATQLAGKMHEMPSRGWASTRKSTDQLSALGSVETRTLPPASTATQSVREAQEMPKIVTLPSALLTCQADSPPVGFVDVRILPAPSLATQRLSLGHATPYIGIALFVFPALSTDAATQVPAPPAGLVEVRMFPASSAATQNVFETQEIEVSAEPP